MGSELNISVNPAAAYTLTVTGLANPATAGTASNFTVSAYDQYGNVATGYGGTIHFTSSDSQAMLPSNYTFTTSDAGVHTFSATLKTAGVQSITATDTATASIMGSELNISVKPAAGYSLTVTGLANPATAGTASNFTVSAYDQYGNVATGYAGMIHFTSSDSQAVVPGNYTFTTSDAGVHTFSATLKTVGVQSITATDTATASIMGSELNISVNPAAAYTLTVTGLANPATAGTASNFTVSAYDQYGNVATGYAGTIHFTSSDSQAVVPGNYTFTTSDAGVHTFSATLKTAGMQSITATDTATASIMGSELNISVKPAAAYSLTVSGLANPGTAGTASNFTVSAYDQYGNVAIGYAGTIHFTSSASQAVLPGNYTFTTNDAGVHTFSATLKTAGVQSITATDTATASIMGSELNISVKPAAAYTLTVSGLANPATASTASNFTVTTYDQYGNVATGYAGTIHFTSSDSQAVLPANYTFTTSDAGVHTFSATLKTAGANRSQPPTRPRPRSQAVPVLR